MSLKVNILLAFAPSSPVLDVGGVDVDLDNGDRNRGLGLGPVGRGDVGTGGGALPSIGRP